MYLPLITNNCGKDSESNRSQQTFRQIITHSQEESNDENDQVYFEQWPQFPELSELLESRREWNNNNRGQNALTLNFNYSFPVQVNLRQVFQCWSDIQNDSQQG